MLDRILLATPKQWAIVWFALGISIGSYFAYDLLKSYPRDTAPDGLPMWTIALVFAATSSFGTIPGLFFLMIHLWVRGKPEDSQLVGPWASEVEKELVRNLTAEEKHLYRRKAAAYGAWSGIVCGGLAISIGLLLSEYSLFAAVRVGICSLMYIGCFYYLGKRHRQFLASTSYAETNGITASQIGRWF